MGLRIDFETPNSRITREMSSQLTCILALKASGAFLHIGDYSSPENVRHWHAIDRNQR